MSESRVRENRMHGSTGGRWSSGQLLGAAGPGPVRWKTPPRWPGRDLNRRAALTSQRPTSPMFCFSDDGEALAGILRPGNAAANSGADQLAVVDMAIAQLPGAVAVGHRVGDIPSEVRERVVVRADTAGHVQAFIAGLVVRNIEFSISARVSDVLDAAIMRVP